MTLLQRALLKTKLYAVHMRPKSIPTPRPKRAQSQLNGRRHNSSQTPSSSNGPPKPEATYKPPKASTPSKDAKPEEPIDVPTALWHRRLGPVTDFFSWFHRTQAKSPLTVQLCTTLIAYLCGDLLAQEIGGEEYSGNRTVRMLTIGAIASIPGYKWFLWLGNHFNYPSRWLSIFTKVCVQQAVFTPIFNTYFFGMQAILTGESPSGTIERIKAAVPISMLNSLKLWPAVTAFSFAFIMPQYRFMFSGVFAVCWQAYLSFLNRKEEKEERVGMHVVRAVGRMNERSLKEDGKRV